MKFRSLLVLLILSCALTSARADDASKLAKVEEFFKIAKLDQLSAQVMKQTMDQVNSGMMQQMMGVTVSPSQQQRLDEFSGKVAKVVSNAMSWETIEPEYAKLYAAAYTEQQLDDILVFYKSPTGQALIEKTPILLKQSSSIVQQRMSAAMPELQKLIKDFAAQETNTTRQAKPKE